MGMNVKNRTIFTGDCLHIMRGMADECIDLIYLDPPFNSNANYAAPIGSEAAGAEFKDTWGLSDIDLAWWGEIEEAYPALYKLLAAVREVHSKSMMSYLIYMAVRVIEMKRLLKETGSIYLHCDPTASHYLKLMMDSIFKARGGGGGGGGFQNEIVWCYRGMTPKSNRFNSKHDSIYFYSASGQHTFNEMKGEPTPGSLRTYQSAMRRGYNANHARGMVVIFDEAKYRQAVADGKIPPGMRESYFDGGAPRLLDWWADIKILGGPKNKERTNYPTQKPLALLQRIIKASSNEGDLILDPFCGCATACIAAEVESRKWIGIDVSEKAFELVKSRLKREVNVGALENKGDHGPIFGHEAIHRTDIPTDRAGKRSGNIKHTLYGLQEGACNGCLSWFPFRNMTLDHKTPRSKGGTDTDDNLQLLCGACNSKKGNHPMEELIAALTAEGIRH